MRKLLHDILTENNGTSYCPLRCCGVFLAVLGIPAFVGGSLFSAWATGHFNAMEFAGGFASIMGSLALLGGGIAIKAKTDTE